MSNRLLLGVGPSPYGGSFVGDNLLLEDGDNFLLENGDQLYLENEAFNPVYDSDAQAYMTAVENADGQELESGVKSAINTFVLGCKSDGIWDAIKASCILAGARTLSGAIQPLVGTAPTNYNFVSGDYDRKTGLIGNGSTKYLGSNRNNNTDPQNNKHYSVYTTSARTPNTVAAALIGAGINTDNGSSYMGANTNSTGQFFFRNNNSSNTYTVSGESEATGFAGTSRSLAANFDARVSGTTHVVSYSSVTPFNANFVIFGRGTTSSPEILTTARISFYSIGEALNLALLDSRVSTLISQIGAAIP
jgi:hypothetical protein